MLTIFVNTEKIYSFLNIDFSLCKVLSSLLKPTH